MSEILVLFAPLDHAGPGDDARLCWVLEVASGQTW